MSIAKGMELRAMLARCHTVPISVLIPLTIHMDEQRPVISIGVDSIGLVANIADTLSERVVAGERLTVLNVLTSLEVGSFHDALSFRGSCHCSYNQQLAEVFWPVQQKIKVCFVDYFYCNSLFFLTKQHLSRTLTSGRGPDCARIRRQQRPCDRRHAEGSCGPDEPWGLDRQRRVP